MSSQLFRRYLLKHWIWPFLGALLLYGGLIQAQQLVAISKVVFEQGAALRWLLPLWFLALPETLGMVLPMAAVLGGLMGTQQLAESSELVAAQGLGVGYRNFIRPWIMFGLALIVLGSLNAHILVPWTARLQTHLQVRAIQEAKERVLHPGGAPWYPPRDPAHPARERALWLATTGELHALEVDPTYVQHTVAQSFTWSIDGNGVEKKSLNIVLNDISGTLYQRQDARVIQLQQKSQTLTCAIREPSALLRQTRVRHVQTGDLLRMGDVGGAWIELTRRITLPIASAALLLLGIAFGLGHPRFQKGGAFVKSLGLILVYYLCLRFCEGLAVEHVFRTYIPILLLPIVFIFFAIFSFNRGLRPHRTRHGFLLPRMRRVWASLGDRLARTARRLHPWAQHPSQTTTQLHATSHRNAILQRWARRLWWRNWSAVLGAILVLFFLIEYANLASDLAKNDVPWTTFLAYYLWNLPTLLAVVLPLTFLLGAILSLSEASMTREWLALRAGGGSLLQWMRMGGAAWGTVLVMTFGMQVWLAPIAYQRADNLYRSILNRPPLTNASKPWMHLGGTGVLWQMEDQMRWGFPLKPVATAPALLRWHLGDSHCEALGWNGLQFLQGPSAQDLFPEPSLRDSAKTEQTPTLDLMRWQKWAPDPERATILWARLLGWLAGPLLLFSILAHAFPPLRGGRGRAVGLALAVGLLFLGAQALFNGAAKAGEIPPAWGILAPLLLAGAAGFLQIHKLRT